MGPAVMLAMRNAAYGVSLAPILRGRLRERALLAQLVIDESTAMARAQDDPAAARRAFLATGLSVWLCWNAGTLAGALLGGGLGDPRALGLDAMFPAAFLALLAPQLRRPGAPVAAVAGAMLAVALRAVRARRPAGHRRARRRRAGPAGGERRPDMSWTALLALCAASYALKAVGPVLAGGRQLGPQVRRTLDLVAVPLLAALILVQTVGDGDRLAIDARVPALAVAAVLVWRRAPFLVVVLAAAGTAALLRMLA